MDWFFPGLATKSNLDSEYIRDKIISSSTTILPDKILAKSADGYIEHRYKSGAHKPKHVHVIDKNGKDIRVGQNGKPLKGEGELNRLQQKLIEENKGKIRQTLKKIGKALIKAF
jgi:hypothetical protein